MHPPKVVIIGAGTSGYDNTGDDAIFRSMVAELRKQHPDLQVSLISVNKPGAYNNINVYEIPFNNIREIVKEIRECDLFILGGGGIYYDYYGLDAEKILTREQSGITLYTGVTLTAHMLNIPVMVFAVGVGPLFTDEGKAITKMAFDCADVVTVRDTGTKELLASMGVAVESIKVTADPAYLLEGIHEQRINRLLTRFKSQDHNLLIGVALREWEHTGSPANWFKAIRDALDHCVEVYNARILFIPFHRTTSEVSDKKISTLILDEMRYKQNAIVLPDYLAAEEKAALIGKCDLVLGMRLHSIIFSIKYGIPFVALEYDPKIKYSLCDSGLTEFGLRLDQLTPDGLIAMMDKVYQNRKEIKKILLLKNKRLTSLAKDNIELAGKFLTSPSMIKTSHSVDDRVNGLIIRLIEKYDDQSSLVESLREDISTHTKTIHQQSNDIIQFNNSIVELNSLLDQKILENKILSDEITAIKEVVCQKTIEGEQLQQEIAALKQIVDMQSKEIGGLMVDIEKAQAEHKTLDSQIGRLSMDLHWYQEEVDRRQFLHKENPLLKFTDQVFRSLIFWERYGFKELIRKIVEKWSGKSSAS